MNNRKYLFSALFCLFILFNAHTIFAELRLPMMVSDSMVLQRDTKLKIWGWADKGEKIRVKFKGKNYSATTDSEGKWMVWLLPSKAGGPYTMEIKGEDSTITLRDVLVGDVWLCAGQSNMVHYLDLHKERYANEIAQADYPQIRQFLVPTNPRLVGPANILPGGSWKAANPQNVLRFSVVAYFFAKKLYDEYQIPVGLINASVGGTPIEAWTSEEGLKKFPELVATIETNKDTAYVNRVNRVAALKRRQQEHKKTGDVGLTGPLPWYDPTYQPKNWRRINIPGYWEDQGIRDLNGSVWYRKEIDVPASMTGVPARISMGRIVDADHIYINGELVGSKTYQYPQRRYDIATGILKPGKNILVIRVQNYDGKGGFVPDKPYYLAAGGDTLDLKGYWKYKVGEVFPRQDTYAGGISAQNQPSSLYNGMVAPYTDYALKGILWYQGESNTARPKEYEELMAALIQDWRSQWENKDLPFLYVQLPNYMEIDYHPSESSWAELRESQRKTLTVPNTAMVVALDLGEWNDVHPGNKKPIGDRLALAAQKLAYEDNDIVYSGPLYDSFAVESGKVILHFDHVGSGLISRDGEELKWFAIAGEDRNFVWADTEIRNDKVIVWSDEVTHPAYVRYAWADNPAGANLYNKEGLPASPFEAKLIDTRQLWHGKKAAVVLTYDDALDVHLDHAVPALDSLGLKATFYLTAAFPGCKNRMSDWKQVADNGHELGNHTLYHPCDASKQGRSWVEPENDLSKYSTEEIVREIELTNAFLRLLDGKEERTFAYTCGDTETGEGSFIDSIKSQFVSMRGVNPQLNTLESINFDNINCYVVTENNQEQMVSWAEKAREENALLVILFHGVGGGHGLNVDLNTHNEFLSYLKNHQDDYWVATMLEASKNAMETLNQRK